MSSKDRAVFPASKYKDYGKYYIPVTFFHEQTGKPVTINECLVDTGATSCNIGSDEARLLGIDIESGKGPYTLSGTLFTPLKGNSYYIHDLKIQIGKLKPVTVTTNVSTIPVSIPIIGWKEVLRKYRVTTSFDELSIENFITAVVPFINKGKELPDANIYIQNIENDKFVEIPVTIDTGGYTTTIDKKYMRLLGINAATIPTLRKFYLLGKTGYALKMKLAKELRPITTDIYFEDLPAGWGGTGILGMGALLKDKKSYNITFEKDRVKYEEVFYGTAGVSNSGRNYRNRYV